MTSRSWRPFPPRMWMTMRRLSISGICKLSQFGTPCPGAIERHQDNAMKPSRGRVDEVGHFFWAQDAGQVSRLLRIRCLGHAPGFLEGPSEKETERGQPWRDSACGEP